MISKATWWPGHIVPKVQVFQWIGSKVPSIDMIKNLPLLPMMSWRNPALQEGDYAYGLLSRAESEIPKADLIFIGNLQGDDLIPFSDANYFSDSGCEWENFEFNVLYQYSLWNTPQGQRIIKEQE